MIGAEYKKGAGKTYQLEKYGETGFQRYFSLDKVGRGKYEILEIYEEPLPIEDKRNAGNARGVCKIKQNCFKVPDHEALLPGVYKIENDEYVYVGSTTRKLSSRFAEHYYNRNGKQDKTQEILYNGGIFTCLQSFDSETEEKIIRECEAKYIREYRSTNKTLLNDKAPEIISKEEKIDYDFIIVPKEYFDDISNVLMDAGYLIMGKMVYNKKFID